MNAKQDYPYVWKWGAYMGSYGYYIKQQVRQARADKAPANAIHRKDDGSWATTDDITNPTLREYLGLEPRKAGSQ